MMRVSSARLSGKRKIAERGERQDDGDADQIAAQATASPLPGWRSSSRSQALMRHCRPSKAAREHADDGDDREVEEELAVFRHQIAAGRVDGAEQQAGDERAGYRARAADRDDDQEGHHVAQRVVGLDRQQFGADHAAERRKARPPRRSSPHRPSSVRTPSAAAMAALSTEARSLTPKAVFSIAYQSAARDDQRRRRWRRACARRSSGSRDRPTL